MVTIIKMLLVEIEPREGEKSLRTEDILKAIEDNKDELALVLFGGVNYYSGHVLDMKTITAAAHKANGAYCGFDLAHAAGNITTFFTRLAGRFCLLVQLQILKCRSG